jgi:hypothetical protein
MSLSGIQPLPKCTSQVARSPAGFGFKSKLGLVGMAFGKRGTKARYEGKLSKSVDMARNKGACSTVPPWNERTA